MHSHYDTMPQLPMHISFLLIPLRLVTPMLSSIHHAVCRNLREYKPTVTEEVASAAPKWGKRKADSSSSQLTRRVRFQTDAFVGFFSTDVKPSALIFNQQREDL